MKWFSICSNGAVALGAFEAGVVAQLYADIAEVNSQSEQKQFGIDAVAGASAGAVTGVILAQAIAAGSSPEQLTNRLYNTWVASLSLDALLGDTNNMANSLFDPATMKAISKKVLLADDQMESAQESANAAPVVVSIALTNVDGIPYKIKVDGPEVIASIYGDYETVVVQDGVPYSVQPVEFLVGTPDLDKDHPYGWKEIGELAITSAAFPFSFQSHLLKRDLSKYKDSIYPEGKPITTFNYVDGGVLDNNPIGRAIDATTYADRLFRHPFDDHSIIVIEPDPPTEAQALAALAEIEKSQDTNGVPPLQLAGKIVSTYFNNAFYKDLEQATAVNAQLANLQMLVDTNKITAAQHQQVVDALGIGHLRQIKIERIVPDPKNGALAGAFRGHFGGFLKQEYRAYDFGLGCETARKWFEGLVGAELGSKLQVTAGERPTPGGYAGVGTSQLNDTEVKIANRLDQLLKDNLRLNRFEELAESLVVHQLILKKLRRLFTDQP